jgi:hypothetical protein
VANNSASIHTTFPILFTGPRTGLSGMHLKTTSVRALIARIQFPGFEALYRGSIKDIMGIEGRWECDRPAQYVGIQFRFPFL